MQLRLPLRIWAVASAVGLVLSLGCGLISRFSGTEEANLPPTRTPLPTFTVAPTTQAFISIAPPPTETPTPSPTAEPPTPEPQAPEAQATEPAPTPEPTATETPVPAPAQPPPPPPEEPAPPAGEPPPPAEPVAGPNGVIGKITFRDGRNTYAVGERVFVNIEVTNVESGLKNFGILGLTPSSGSFQTSWDNGSIAAGETFRHEDGLAFSVPGAHQLWLSICYSSKEECQGPDGNWERFEPGLEVIVQ